MYNLIISEHKKTVDAFRHWVEDCRLALGGARSPSVFLVGSSMGGMISLKVASEEGQKRVQGMVLVAPAVNTLRKKYK